MTTPRATRQRQADANRRKVNSRGKRVQRPRAPRKPAPKARRPKYGRSVVLAGLASMFGAFSFASSSILWGVGAVATATASSIAWRIEYKRELAQVKATGHPIGAKPKAGDPLPPGATPTNLDPPAVPRPRATRKPAPDKHGPPGHEATCTAKTKEACPYWRKANPGRAKASTKRTTTRTRAKKP